MSSIIMIGFNKWQFKEISGCLKNKTNHSAVKFGVWSSLDD
ncbi:hypothetical protein [Alysiella crassa]|nr:hypothetical protein [Alysiella crassa]